MSKKGNSSPRGQEEIRLHAHGTIMHPIVTPDMVEIRARELAIIAGRDPNRVTTSDRIQAKKELLGDDSGDAAVDDTGMLPSGMGAPPSSTGRLVERRLPDDDETEIQTVLEGIAQAEHDQMLQAARTRTSSEG